MQSLGIEVGFIIDSLPPPPAVVTDSQEEQLKRRKYYIGSWLQRFQSMMDWLHGHRHAGR